MESRRKLLEERTQTIGALLLLVNELKDSPEGTLQNGRLCFAIRMLGDLRAAEAAQPLLDLIDMRFPGFVSDTRSPEDPETIQALVNIGKPASTKAVDYLASDKSTKRAMMYVRVIAQVEGIELGKVMVRLAADKEKDPEKKARLLAAIALFDKAGEPIPWPLGHSGRQGFAWSSRDGSGPTALRAEMLRPAGPWHRSFMGRFPATGISGHPFQRQT
jgi:hypothetical protein